MEFLIPILPMNMTSLRLLFTALLTVYVNVSQWEKATPAAARCVGTHCFIVQLAHPHGNVSPGFPKQMGNEAVEETRRFQGPIRNSGQSEGAGLQPDYSTRDLFPVLVLCLFAFSWGVFGGI